MKFKAWAYFLFLPLLCTSGTCSAYEIAAWTFGDRASLEAASDRAAIDEVDVDWYTSQKNLTLKGDGVDVDFVTTAQSRGIKVFATVSNYSNARGDFDPDLAFGILNNPAARTKHINAIVNLCVTKKYDGVDLDWEALYPRDRGRFTQFVETLAAGLHRKGKLLAIAVHAKTSEPGDWNGPKAQDWKRIGAAVDEFKIMTYDYSGPWSDPGPISPPEWADAVLSFAETIVPSSKIMMGVPFYGYNWQTGNCTDVYWDSAKELIRQNGGPLKRDTSKEALYKYTDEAGAAHTVIFQDRPALAAKFRMLLQNHSAIRGIAIWRMGGESPAFWTEIVQKLR